MASDIPTERPKITLFGQSKSGKTNMLATLVMNRKAWLDIDKGWDGLSDIGVESDADSGSLQEKDHKDLMTQYDAIQTGRDFIGEGSNAVRHYPLILKFIETTVAKRGPIRFGGGPTKTISSEHAVPFEIVDGRGGDSASSEYIDPNDAEQAETLSLREEYLSGLDKSVGVVICMPIKDDEFNIAMANDLVEKILKSIERRKRVSSAVPLKYISICYTKYDLLFDREGANAGLEARSPDTIIDQLHGQAMFDCFRPLFNHQKQAGDDLKILIFPVSTLGFIGGTGAANFYSHKEAPGLLTRVVDPDVDYTDPDLNPEEPGAPQFKDHFPFAMTEQEANSLWQPFNVAPPIVFALTGRATGPLYLTPDEFL